jgi:hypothetical protein
VQQRQNFDQPALVCESLGLALCQFAPVFEEIFVNKAGEFSLLTYITPFVRRIPKPLSTSNMLRFSCDIFKSDGRLGMSSWRVLMEYQWASAAAAPTKKSAKMHRYLGKSSFFLFGHPIKIF